MPKDSGTLSQDPEALQERLALALPRDVVSDAHQSVSSRPSPMIEPVVRHDGFDLESLRLSQDFAAVVGVQKLLTTVPVRKPQGQEFIRVHPEPQWRLQTAVLELKEERETYLVARTLWPELMGEIIPKMLFTAINRQHVLFLWPVRLPGEDGRLDAWNQSALEAAEHAMGHWVRVKASMALGAYEVSQATRLADVPRWPEHTFEDILHIAFKQRYIDTWDHPVLRRLRGEQ